MVTCILYYVRTYMSDPDFSIEVKASTVLPHEERERIITLCSESFGRDYRPFMDTFIDSTHVIGYYQGLLVSHACWITRWLQVEDNPLMKTGYIEAMVTDPFYRDRGYASEILNRLIEELDDYELAALCTSFPEFYLPLGWQIWEGPLFIRTQEGMTPTPGEPVMVYFLPNSPELDINASLSAEWREGEHW